MPHTDTDWGPIDSAEVRVKNIDMTPGLGAGETLVSASVSSVTVETGADPTPTDIVVGGPTIAGNLVILKFAEVVAATKYKVTLSVVTSAQVLTPWTYLTVNP